VKRYFQTTKTNGFLNSIKIRDMKNFIMTMFGFLLVGLYACGTAENKEVNGAITDTAVTSKSTVPEPPYDPDPTDTIPGNLYGVNSSSKQTADLVRLTLQDLYREDLKNNIIDSFGRRFILFEYDLNDDGKNEIFVGLRGSYFCGSGGCTMYLLDNQGNVITKFSVSRDVVIDNKVTNGFQDLFIYSGGKFRIVKYDGQTYPSNPSILPALNVVPGDDLPRALNFVNEPYPWFTF
jgi:hypothetical protein